MRFDFVAYEKVFPTASPAPVQDTAVPPENDAKATDDKPGDDKATPEPEPAPKEPIVTIDDMPGDPGEGA